MRETGFRWLLLATIFLSFAVEWATSINRHHFSYTASGHRKRHRRQGAKLYLPGSYIVPKGEGYGAWGPWGDPSPCSRTCGGGVASQTRICLDVTPEGRSSCVGGDKKYFSCNTQDCPKGSMDFRSEQCAAYDNVPIQDQTYNWVPYLNAPNPCQLNCMPRGENFYQRFKLKVTDGTLCNADSLDVCIDGTCQPVGCDLMLGSNAREDKCRVCGGDGSSCQTISGINSDTFRLGYTDILWIPAGSMSIYIREVAPSLNYLAIRSVVQGKYYLNGDYRPQNSRKFEFAGAVWYYERNPYGLPGPDSLRCQGPTSEPVYLSLLLTSDNVGVKYEYSVSNGTLPNPDQHYSWVFDEFTPCSANCGGGFQTRNVSCASNDELTPVDDNLCDPAHRPPANQSCAEVACPPRWVEGAWGPCSQPCGTGGSQSREVHCEKIISNSLPSIVHDDECFRQLGAKPDLHRRCNEGGNCPKWHTGPWRPCDKLCGQGKQIRNVTCFIKRDGKIEKLGDAECSEEKPANEQACMLHPCDGVDWITSEWKGCDSCNSKNRTRSVKCSTLTEQVDDRFCAHHKLPALAEACGQLPPCPAQWFASEWSQCNGQCGEGVQTRLVFCGKLKKEDNSVTILKDEDCVAENKLENSKNCTNSGTDCPAVWYTGPWSTCTEKCGTEGLQYRRVVCMRGNETVDTDKCDADSLPEKGRECNRKACDADETIPVTVGSTQVYDEDEEYCPEEDYPEENADDEEEEKKDRNHGTGDMDFETLPPPKTTPESRTSTEFLTTPEGSGDPWSTTFEPIEGSGKTTIDVTTESGATTESTDSSTVISTTESGASTTESTDSTTVISTTESGASTTESTDSTTVISTTESDLTTTVTDISTTDATTTESYTSTTVTVAETTEDNLSTTAAHASTTEAPTSTDFTTIISSTEASSTQSTESSSSGGTETETTPTEETPVTGETTSSGSSETPATGTETTETPPTDSTSTESAGSSSFSTDSSTTESEFTSETSPSWSTTIMEVIRKKNAKCIPRPKCIDSEFGCCADNRTAAAGPFDAGCLMAETCSKTVHGCCPDGVSAAGPGGRGCPDSHCEETLFGCCESDGSTPAQGNDQEGCPPPAPACLKSKFKCCKDGQTPAKGKHGKGCPETVPNCKDTKFKCCYDNVTAATKPKGQGCPCNATQHGCCPDGKATATGPHFQGCIMACNSSAFGCCPDGETPAHGRLGEGCCLATAFGCCPDNVREARGPHNEGCDCHYSPFGCCPDNVTSAHGYESEGCGCEHSTHGCCPNGHDAASGPNFEGCACHTMQFGCCPDGSTAVIGPQQRGCRCSESTYGCCGDQQTAATGPNGEGCDCSNSKFGCCPDGQTEATGEKFLGCTDVPKNPQESCGLDKAQGVGTNFTVRWFYDTAYGGCSRFWYYGSGGNGNRFHSEDECKSVCVSPPGKAVCHLPKIKGPCESYAAAWYYDAERDVCGQFMYGGCLGNNNRFQSREECQQLCEEPREADHCKLPIEAGSCAGNFVRWAFDSEAKRCSQFVWGGCEGNSNRFSSEAACIQKCETPGTLKEECRVPEESTNCTQTLPKWRFNVGENRCVPFYFKGCGSRANVFDSERACQERCPSVFVQDTCTLEPLVGDCYNYTARWYFNVAEQRCGQFYWGGCGGNENNFVSEQECQRRCEERPTTTTTVAPPSGGFTTEFCFQRADPGPCDGSDRRFFYDQGTGVCREFVYGGCGGNNNNFPDRETCQQYCSQAQDVCQLRMVTGGCDDSVMQWYYDARSDSCSQFAYSGCDGNDNRFNSREECEHRCRHATADTTTRAPAIDSRFGEECRTPESLNVCGEEKAAWYYDERGGGCTYTTAGNCGYRGLYQSEEACERQCGIFRQINVCEYPIDPGTCRAAIPKIYFDQESGHCLDFLYGGCAGGPNRFSSVEECESVCASAKRAQPEAPDDNAISDGCEQYEAACASLPCDYGVERRKTDSGCQECVCRHPCTSLRCGDGERCSLQPTYTERGDRKFIPVCRLPNKPGVCPVLPAGEITQCDRYCNDDADCGGADKCCARGCSFECHPPQGAYETTTGRPQPTYFRPQYPEEPAPPRINEEETPAETAMQVGGLATLRCVFNGYPAPTITWQRGALTIDGTTGRYRIRTDGSLQIVSVYKNDSGVYVCIGNNPLGEVRKEVTLQVRVPVRTSIDTDRTSFAVDSNLTLPCYVEGLPEPEVFWTKDNVPLELSERVQISSANRLTIFQATVNDSGTYTCHANNGISSHSSYVSVRVEGQYIHPNCTDNPLFANCHLIVKGKYCRHQYYASFCCRSCTLAGQMTWQEMLSDQPRFKVWTKK